MAGFKITTGKIEYEFFLILRYNILITLIKNNPS